MKRIPRREFIKRSGFGVAGVIAAPYIVPGRALGLDGATPASERIVIGAIGVGGMGRHDIGQMMQQPDVQYVAVCDVDAERLVSAKQLVDGQYNNADCAAYANFEYLLARDDLDAALIATPDHWHAYLAIAAAKAGLDVYCEKPISLTVAEGRIVADAMRKYNVIYQSGTQRRSIPCFKFAVDAARDGLIGEITEIHTQLAPGRSCPPQPDEEVPAGFDYDRWLGQAPEKPYTKLRCHGSFRWIYDYSGGQLTDIGAHFNDLAQWGNDSEDTGPIRYEGKAEFPTEGLFDTAVRYAVTAEYASGVKLYFHGIEPRAVKFVGTEGWVMVDDFGNVTAEPASILEKGDFEKQEWSVMNGHHRNFLDCVKSRETPIAPPEVAHRSTTVCHIGNICLRLGRALEWDPIAERLNNDDEANAMLSRVQRAPWSLDTLMKEV